MRIVYNVLPPSLPSGSHVNVLPSGDSQGSEEDRDQARTPPGIPHTHTSPASHNSERCWLCVPYIHPSLLSPSLTTSPQTLLTAPTVHPPPLSPHTETYMYMYMYITPLTHFFPFSLTSSSPYTIYHCINPHLSLFILNEREGDTSPSSLPTLPPH